MRCVLTWNICEKADKSPRVRCYKKRSPSSLDLLGGCCLTRSWNNTTTTSSDPPNPPHWRGVVTYFVERVVFWFLGYPPERCNYTTRSVRIPVSIGLQRTELAGNLLQPILPGDAGPIDAILQTSPYGCGFMTGLIPRTFAARGYQVLLVSSRGTFGSGGEFDPFRINVEDGKGTVAWMREQA
jgi:hypothetical protein